MNLSKPIVLSKVVENDLCIGCGACIQACSSKALDVKWNNYGFLVATSNDNQCDAGGACIEVCPFNPEPGPEYKNEDGLAETFLYESPKQHPKIGRYYDIYAGYSLKHRITSSSGGIATFMYEKLFDKGLINHVVTVGEAGTADAHYQYNIVSNKNNLLSISKTRYHPVTLANALEKIKQLDGKVAISGVGCFIKAIRLAQDKDPVLKEKITFLVGIICGGVKSKFFTDYLAGRAGTALPKYSNPEYRVKEPTSTAMDYGFSCTDNPSSATKLIKMREVGDMWGTGLFKANACDFCDDVTTELADISLGDAWLKPYNQDGRGHNVIVSRSFIADQILLEGRDSGELELEHLPQEQFLASQQGSFNHRHDGMSTRLALATSAGAVVPPKRVDKVKLPIHLRLVQQGRRQTRLKSLEIWAEYKNSVEFDRRMKPVLLKLKLVTRLSHAVRKAKKISGMKS
ncbi:Coenzyme F420 hydrogenase/dehydrogenase, beta subunit C-terminal domain [Oceanisphaera psychrotolerans]|uniref:4Fe-4S ferredoxin n=1 Tax=Oceanisphaera psychrotolerans TaxID=1414654 RepID=A0A1J4QBN6_9GAMM|nr:Coenzyme F420 hydrogenase/dehydrogenase, beta subunit C-terminal domain [Oceanisphaera psychrotolerans]OIN07239.1 4Fe-4S ferredoxin [Oceanisphaera psychrotolerans]